MNMQRINKYSLQSKALAFLSLLSVLFFSSCEDVVKLDLETGPTKLVVDAEIIWQKGTTGNVQTIKVSKTAPYYNNTTPKVSGAQVKVENSNGDVFTFNETEPGSYVCNNFVPVINMEYTLSVTAEGQSFKAVEKLTSVTPIDRVEQEIHKDAVGDEFIEIVFYYKDPINQANYYLTDFKSDFLLYPEYSLSDDQFYDGNEVNIRFTDEDKIQPGKTIDITHRGVSKNFSNYMSLILEIYGGSPFSIPPGNIRGNIVNTTDPNNFAFGYFRLCEADKVSYLVK
jgi:hypothetical protein